MTAYIARKGVQKKKEILEKREAELLHCIKNDAPEEKLAKAAEKVRAAQLAVVKCLLYETEAVSPAEEMRFATRRRHIENDRDHWDHISVVGIIDHYRSIKPPNG